MSDPLDIHDVPVDGVVRVSNDSVSLGFLPSVGGRLISVDVSGTELMWRDDQLLHDTPGLLHHPDGTGTSMGSWRNVGGSKTWPAPQGWDGPHQWPGPPDPVLDSGLFTYSAEHDATGAVHVTMVSQFDARTGLQVTREFHLPYSGSGFTQVSRFTNRSPDTVTWAVWEVAQIDTAAFFDPSVSEARHLLVGADGSAPPLNLFPQGDPLSATESVSGLRLVPVVDAVGKLGFPDATGYLGLVRPDGAVLEWTFQVLGAQYPDGGCACEVWMQAPRPEAVIDGFTPSAHLVEFEAMSPLAVLQPGGSVELVIEWRVSSADPSATRSVEVAP